MKQLSFPFFKPKAPDYLPVMRRFRVKNCLACQEMKGDGPSHDPSWGCQCGKEEHCSCRSCF